MNWYKTAFTMDRLANGNDQQLQKMILDVIANSDEALDYRVRFAAYRTDAQPDGTFTAYVTEEVIERFPHLKRNFIVDLCDKPNASSVKTWVGIEPLASQFLQGR